MVPSQGNAYACRLRTWSKKGRIGDLPEDLHRKAAGCSHFGKISQKRSSSGQRPSCLEEHEETCRGPMWGSSYEAGFSAPPAGPQLSRQRFLGGLWDEKPGKYCPERGLRLRKARVWWAEPGKGCRTWLPVLWALPFCLGRRLWPAQLSTPQPVLPLSGGQVPQESCIGIIEGSDQGLLASGTHRVSSSTPRNSPALAWY